MPKMLSQQTMKNRFFLKLGYTRIYLFPIWTALIILILLSLVKNEITIAIFSILTLFTSMTLYVRWVVYIDDRSFRTFFVFEGFRTHFMDQIVKVYVDKKLGSGQYIFFIDYCEKNKTKKAKFEFGGNRKYLIEVLNSIKSTNFQDIDIKSFNRINVDCIDGIFICLPNKMNAISKNEFRKKSLRF